MASEPTRALQPSTAHAAAHGLAAAAHGVVAAAHGLVAAAHGARGLTAELVEVDAADLSVTVRFEPHEDWPRSTMATSVAATSSQHRSSIIADGVHLDAPFRRRDLGVPSYAERQGTLVARNRLELSRILRRPVRRDIASLGTSHPIIDAFATAVRAMKALPASDRRNWSRQARIHSEFCPHGNWLFLPWHRCYLFYFERICRKLSGLRSFALPYWNWTTNPQIPTVFWGDGSNPLFDSTRLATPNSVADPASVGPEVMQAILDEPNFLVFGSGAIPLSVPQTQPSTYGRLEGTPHNYIHGFVGGNMGRVNRSPLDPVFWLHHNMIERTWMQWNLVRQHPNTQDGAWLDREFTEFCDENGDPVRITVKRALLLPIRNYRYDQLMDGQAAMTAEAPLETRRRAKTPETAKSGAIVLDLADESEAVHERNAARAQQGARVELEVLAREVTTEPLTVAIGETATVPLQVEPPLFELLADDDDREVDVRTLLVFDGVNLDFTTDFSVHVFVNHPQAGPETPPEDPRFVGAFSSFHSAHSVHSVHGEGEDEHPARGRFVFDLDPVLERLGVARGQVDVNIVLVPFADRPLPENQLEVQRVELQFAHEIIEELG